MQTDKRGREQQSKLRCYIPPLCSFALCTFFATAMMCVLFKLPLWQVWKMGRLQHDFFFFKKLVRGGMGGKAGGRTTSVLLVEYVRVLLDCAWFASVFVSFSEKPQLESDWLPGTGVGISSKSTSRGAFPVFVPFSDRRLWTCGCQWHSEVQSNVSPLYCLEVLILWVTWPVHPKTIAVALSTTLLSNQRS